MISQTRKTGYTTFFVLAKDMKEIPKVDGLEVDADVGITFDLFWEDDFIEAHSDTSAMIYQGRNETLKNFLFTDTAAKEQMWRDV